MSRESKILTASQWSVQDTISHYEAFGWELLSLNGSQITMSRETQNPVYAELVKHQAQYEELVKQYGAIRNPDRPLSPEPVSVGTVLLTFVCLIFPCVLYCVYKHKQFAKFKEAVAAYEMQCAENSEKKRKLREQMEQTVLESRGIFFSKQ